MGQSNIKRSSLLLVGGLALFFAAPWGVFYLKGSPISMWLGSLAATLGLFWLLQKIAGKSLLTDERGRWSLARLQLLAWTGFLLPTIWTMVLLKFQAEATDPLDLGMDDNLWALLGISAVSLIGSPILLARKRTSGTLAPRGTAAAAAGSPSEDSGDVSDLYLGEETATENVIDISRVQMLLFTAMALLVYFIACWRDLAKVPAEFLKLPPMSANLVTLIGISHATYLAAKVPKHS